MVIDIFPFYNISLNNANCILQINLLQIDRCIDNFMYYVHLDIIGVKPTQRAQQVILIS